MFDIMMGKKIFFCFVCLYFSFVLISSFNIDGFKGLELYIVWSILVMFALFYVFHKWESALETAEERVEYHNKRKYFIIFLMVVIPFLFGLGEKLSILFVDIDKFYLSSKNVQGQIIGFKSGGGGRGSLPSRAMVKIYDNKKIDEFAIFCDLLVERCDYGEMKGLNVSIKGANGRLYPLQDKFIVFEMASESGKFFKGVDYHIQKYENNKFYIFCFIFFIYIPVLFFVFYAPFFKKT